MKPAQRPHKATHEAASTDPRQRAEVVCGLAQRLLDEAKRQGASAAEVAASTATGLAVTVRKGELETVAFHNDQGLAVTVYVGARKGAASTSDISPDAVRDTVRAALDIAKHTEEDACNGLADAERMATALPDLDLHHPWALDVPGAQALATETEAAALSFDARVVNSEGAEVATHSACNAYGNSHGFLAPAWGTRHSASCAVIAADDDGMQTDHWHTVGRAKDDLQDGAEVGREAARRAVARLGRRPIRTGEYPVLFAPPVAIGIVGHLLSALSGTAQYRKETYLAGSLGKRATAAGITLAEHPHRRKGLGSAAFDGDGVATRAKPFIADGVVTNYLLGAYSARRLGLATTGNAGGVFNLDLEANTRPVAELLREMDTGLVVTSLMGQGVNLVTGDYSRGATGFWVVGGEVQHPVDNITIAGNLDDMCKNIVGCGDDVDRRGNVRAGSLLVARMTVAA